MDAAAAESTAAAVTEQEPPAEATGANAQPLQTQLFQLRAECEAQFAMLRANFGPKADEQRIARLREIAVHTAITHAAGSKDSQGHAVDTDRIVKSAAVYYAFLDAGTVPA